MVSMSHHRHIILLGSLFLFFATLPLAPSAQAQAIPYEIPAHQVDITLAPLHPGPEMPVKLTLEAYTVNMVNASIAWFANGKEIVDARNETTIVRITKRLGESERITAVITRDGREVERKEIVIRPSAVDIIIESNSYTPPFYRGRKLPASGTKVRAIAVPLTKEKGDASAYSYRWEYDDELINGGVLKGKQSIDLTLSRFTNGSLHVVVYDENGTLIGDEYADIPVVEPEMHFYEVNPLKGTLHRELSKQVSLIGEEITVAGLPYFADTELKNGDGVGIWTIGNTNTKKNESAPHRITLQGTGETGATKINFSYETAKTIPERVKGFFTILLN